MKFKKNIFILFLNFYCGFLFCCVKNPMPIIYHSQYCIQFGELRDFVAPAYRSMYDAWLVCDRAKAVYEYFQKNKNNVKFFLPQVFAQDKDLLAVHSADYINSFDELENIRKIIGFKFNQYNMPDVDILKKKVLLPARYAVAGTILGIDLALKYGCAINLSGGFHHAGISSGGGFCFFNDIAIAALKLLEIKKDDKNFKIFIVDLDAHWGNGTQEILGSNKQVFVFDVYNEDRQLFKGTPEDKNDHILNFPVSEGTPTDKYLEIIKKKLPVLINQLKPNFIIYNSGLDVFEEDNVGGLKVSANGIIERDFFVFNLALKQDIPILMLLSGGYTQTCIKIIENSIDNLLKIFNNQ